MQQDRGVERFLMMDGLHVLVERDSVLASAVADCDRNLVPILDLQTVPDRPLTSKGQARTL